LGWLSRHLVIHKSRPLSEGAKKPFTFNELRRPL
jgi:hypothetical protein